MTDHRIEQQYAFLMEQIIKRYRQVAAHALNAHQAGISVDQWVVLKQISEHHGCSQVEIALSTVKDAPTTTRIIDQLTKKELIGKQRHPERPAPDRAPAPGRTRVPQGCRARFYLPGHGPFAGIAPPYG